VEPNLLFIKVEQKKWLNIWLNTTFQKSGTKRLAPLFKKVVQNVWLHLSQRWKDAFKYQHFILYFFLKTIYKMSKVSFSRELLGTIRFIFDKTKSRTLNATQAYDKSTSQIVLASYSATSTINTPTKSLGGPAPVIYGAVGVTATQYAELVPVDKPKRAGLEAPAPKSITIGWSPTTEAPAAKQTAALFQKDTAQFSSGIKIDAGVFNTGEPIGSKSNATKEIFAGNITVGTGLYREWQGKYAVLKVDLLTDKAILRVYNE